MATAAEAGLATAACGDTRLSRDNTASIASGMPWPRMTGAHFARSATTRPPSIAVGMIHNPG
jgi:hypothetical protein